ncbi:hypothetical protein EI94DRAFT_120656 [Lactarius quietus]|nr:hypothetical protein EI94DRAFT_120656 [Lactarius quietus]
MYTSHFAIFVLAASAAVPALSAPLAIADVSARDASKLAARDPGFFGNDIRDLLKDFELRSEDDSAELFGRDISNAPLHSRHDNLVYPISGREDSEFLDTLKRNFFDNLVSDIVAPVQDVVSDVENAAKNE